MAPQPDALPNSIAGAPPQQWLAAPSPVYLTGEESLRLSSLANLGGVTLQITGRILRPDNNISRVNFQHVPNSSRSIATTIVPLSEGWLLGLTIRATAGTPAVGQVWANLELGIGAGAAFAVDQTLGCGFVTANTPFAWPISVNAQPLDGAGNLRSITGTTPGAGVEISETVPTGARWELLSFFAQYVTSATVGTRNTILTFDDGTNVYGKFPLNNNQAASITIGGSWGQGQAFINNEPQQALSASTPVGVKLGAGHRIRTLTPGIQAGDQYSAVQYLVREWMTGE